MSYTYEFYMQMEDGVELYTAILLPEKGAKCPVIITRSPYEKKQSANLTEEGPYGKILQHCRGTGLSQGVCQAYRNERKDGLELLEWIRKQDFYNGEIFLYGGSYLSSVHFAYLGTGQKDIKGAFLAVQDCKRYNILYRNGFYKTGLHGGWVMGMYKRNEENVRRDYVPETLRTFPLAGITEHIFGERVDFIEEEFLHPDPADPFWQTPEGGSEYADCCNKCACPVLLSTAFYDIYTGGVFDMWKSLTPERKKQCFLVVTPFDHNYNPAPRTEDSPLPDFENGRLREVCPDLHRQFFDFCRGGEKPDFVTQGCLTYYRLFDKKWITSPELANAPLEKCFFLEKDRSLQTAPPPEDGSITYTYNPYAPAPFEGGVCNNFGGMKIQHEPNSRYDIISFVSAPLEEDLLCEGEMEVTLEVSSTAPDSCFYVRLDLVREGKALSLRDDIDSLCRVKKEYTPGEKCLLHYTFAPHAFRLFKGDCLRLDVSSSCVPYFQVHTNRKGLQALQTGADLCRNTVHTGNSFVKLYYKKPEE